MSQGKKHRKQKAGREQRSDGIQHYLARDKKKARDIADRKPLLPPLTPSLPNPIPLKKKFHPAHAEYLHHQRVSSALHTLCASAACAKNVKKRRGERPRSR
jgi:hypothetical protein